MQSSFIEGNVIGKAQLLKKTKKGGKYCIIYLKIKKSCFSSVVTIVYHGRMADFIAGIAKPGIKLVAFKAFKIHKTGRRITECFWPTCYYVRSLGVS